jgi:hypothetical protein
MCVAADVDGRVAGGEAVIVAGGSTNTSFSFTTCEASMQLLSVSVLSSIRQ